MRHVLDKSNGDFALATDADSEPILRDSLWLEHLVDKECKDDAEFYDEKADDVPVDRRLRPSVVNENLGQLHGGKGEGMHAKDDIVHVDSARVPNILIHKPLQVVQCVEVKADWVQHGEFH